MVIVSPWVTVIVGFGVPVLFQAFMKPIRVIVGVEVAATFGGMLIEVIPIALTIKTVMMEILSRRLIIIAQQSLRRVRGPMCA